MAAGWNLDTQIREELSFTDGRIYVRGKIHARGEKKRADYILYYKPNIPIAVIEAKDNRHTVAAGIQQALGYARTLDLPFVFSSNGDAFHFHDRTVQDGDIETEIPLHAFPGPEELWRKYCAYKGIAAAIEPIVSQDYFVDGSNRSPRYYQQTAINQAMTVNKHKKINTAYSIYLALYQGLSDHKNSDDDAYKQFSPDFFDLVIVDECHRGSAREDSKWREILDYFHGATHIGLTATPKETKEISSSE